MTYPHSMIDDCDDGASLNCEVVFFINDDMFKVPLFCIRNSMNIFYVHMALRIAQMADCSSRDDYL